MEGLTLRRHDDRIQSVIDSFLQKRLHGNIQYVVSKSYQMVSYTVRVRTYVSLFYYVNTNVRTYTTYKK